MTTPSTSMIVLTLLRIILLFVVFFNSLSGMIWLWVESAVAGSWLAWRYALFFNIKTTPLPPQGSNNNSRMIESAGSSRETPHVAPFRFL